MEQYQGNTNYENGSVTTDKVCSELGWAYINGLKTMGGK